ncbi:hypothetical protein ACEPAH_3428 [Sanghuangporus vaninii]
MSTQLPPFPSFIQSIRSAIDSNSETANKQLSDVLSLVFEPSTTLSKNIVPALLERIRNASDERELPGNYAILIDTAIGLVSSLPDDEKAFFIGAHPRIGEVKGLSAMSAAEQGQSASTSSDVTPTPPDVLRRLACLNAAYEARYPGLIYITFVNGRTRAQIRDELEEKLREEGVLPRAEKTDGLEGIQPQFKNSDAWRKEVERAICAVRDIAQSRLEKLSKANDV